MINLLLTVLATLGLIFGLFSMVTPIPGGTLIIAASVSLLICVSPTAQFCLRFLRTRFQFLNKSFFFLEEKIGTKINFVSSALKKTRPQEIEEL